MLAARSHASQDLLLSARLGRWLLQLDIRVDLFCVMGFPRSGFQKPGPLGEAQGGGLVVSMVLFARALSPGLIHLPQTGLRPLLPSPSALGPLRGPVVCSVEWKIPPRPCESFQSHPLRRWALERNGSFFPLHGEQAGSQIRGEGVPALIRPLTK